MSKLLSLTLIATLLLLSHAAVDLSKWELFVIDTSKITLHGNRAARLLASGPNNDGFPLLYFDLATQFWVNADTSANGLQITQNEETITRAGGAVFYRPRGVDTTWRRLESIYAKEFSYDFNDEGIFWYIGDPASSPSPTNQQVWAYGRESQPAMGNMNIQAKKIAVEPRSRMAWIVQENGSILRSHGRTWVVKKGQANYITFGTTNTPYIVSKDVVPGGYAIKKWSDEIEDWETIPGIGGVFVALDERDNLYVLTDENRVYRQTGVVYRLCPMCRGPTCQTPVCLEYQGHCTPANDHCLTCPAGSFINESTLTCEPCPAGCSECSSAAGCTNCPLGQYLTLEGTCSDSCAEPFVGETVDGVLKCRRPCDSTPSTPYYYPSDGECRATCAVPIVDPTAPFESCDPCPANCLTCSSTTNCLECESTYFLISKGTCRPDCPEPLNSIEVSPGNWHCEGPCAAETVNIYYDPSTDTCHPACEVPVMTCSAFAI